MQEHYPPMFGSVFLSQISSGFEEEEKKNIPSDSA